MFKLVFRDNRNIYLGGESKLFFYFGVLVRVWLYEKAHFDFIFNLNFPSIGP